MESYQVGDMVRTKEPFNEFYPDIYVIESVREDGTCSIADGIDFAPTNLERVTE